MTPLKKHKCVWRKCVYQQRPLLATCQHAASKQWKKPTAPAETTCPRAVCLCVRINIDRPPAFFTPNHRKSLRLSNNLFVFLSLSFCLHTLFLELSEKHTHTHVLQLAVHDSSGRGGSVMRRNRTRVLLYVSQPTLRTQREMFISV